MEQSNICIEQDCGEPLYSKFWCERHFLTWKNNRTHPGSLTDPIGYRPREFKALSDYYDED